MPAVPSQPTAQRQPTAPGESEATSAARAMPVTIPAVRTVPLHRIHRSRSRLLRATTAGMLATIAVGGLSVVEMRKQITVDVDGEHLQLVTLKGDVGEALDEAGVSVDGRDSLEPAAHDRLTDGGTVTLRRARPVTLDRDGVVTQEWTTAQTAGEFLGARGDVPEGSFVDTAAGDPLPREGAHLNVVTPHQAFLSDNGGPSTAFVAAGLTVGTFLARLGVALGPQDVLDPAPETAVGPDTRITVTRVATADDVTREETPAPQREEDDPGLPRGERTVVDPGAPGATEITYRVTRVNGAETQRVETGRREATPARPATVKVGTKVESAPRSAAAPASSHSGVWDSIAQCESTGNWAIDSGNGFSGGLQFTPSTWLAYGGGQYAPAAHLASREQQIAVAEKVLAGQGWGAWPACTSKLGLR